MCSSDLPAWPTSATSKHFSGRQRSLDFMIISVQGFQGSQRETPRAEPSSFTQSRQKHAELNEYEQSTEKEREADLHGEISRGDRQKLGCYVSGKSAAINEQNRAG